MHADQECTPSLCYVNPRPPVEISNTSKEFSVSCLSRLAVTSGFTTCTPRSNKSLEARWLISPPCLGVLTVVAGKEILTFGFQYNS
jgi:hypothetical protein